MRARRASPAPARARAAPNPRSDLRRTDRAAALGCRDLDDDPRGSGFRLAPDAADRERSAARRVPPAWARAPAAAASARSNEEAAPSTASVAEPVGGNAEFLADRVIERRRAASPAASGFGRHDIERQQDAALVADRCAAFVGEAMRCRPPHRDGFHIGRFREIETRRHAGITGIPPIGLPSGCRAGARRRPAAPRGRCRRCRRRGALRSAHRHPTCEASAASAVARSAAVRRARRAPPQ